MNDAKETDPLREALAEIEVHDGDRRSDPFFTARVLDALPEPLRFTGLTPRRRAAVLAGFHLLAAAVAYAIVAGRAPAIADQAHDLLGDTSAFGVDASAPWLTALVLGIVAVVAFVSSTSHGPPRPTGARGPT
jgi:hypothetical protein